MTSKKYSLFGSRLATNCSLTFYDILSQVVGHRLNMNYFLVKCLSVDKVVFYMIYSAGNSGLRYDLAINRQRGHRIGT